MTSPAYIKAQVLKNPNILKIQTRTDPTQDRLDLVVNQSLATAASFCNRVNYPDDIPGYLVSSPDPLQDFSSMLGDWSLNLNIDGYCLSLTLNPSNMTDGESSAAELQSVIRSTAAQYSSHPAYKSLVKAAVEYTSDGLYKVSSGTIGRLSYVRADVFSQMSSLMGLLDGNSHFGDRRIQQLDDIMVGIVIRNYLLQDKSLKSETVGNYSYTNDGGTGLNDAEKTALLKYRLLGVA